MSVFAAALGGAAVGAGLWWTARVLSRPGLADLLPPPDLEPEGGQRREGERAWGRAGERKKAGIAGAVGTAASLARAGGGVLARFGWPGPRTRRDLAVCGIDTDRHRAEVTVSAFAGATLFLFLLATAVPPASPMPLPAALGLGASCLVLCLVAPALVRRHRAARSRARLGAATSVIADLVGVALAGGSGVTGALTAATRRGNGAAFDLIRRCLHEANLRTRPPWDALSDLAERTGVRELDELASSIRIAGTDGARVRASVRAKAAALRTHRLAALEAQAHEATERMTLPVMLLVLGFLLLMGYPAATHVTSGF
ncbi:type II secretion system F family protein [Nocardiopsis alborubida]|uniref:Type II secretion system protein GspF domain-containing protein n=1 Tax=Nocardiopsis alborubida TaxID=146802 RepID=A0A7X6ML25_9ACTN|nr:type II secretion system F family protein [Nocardiopsis alborubida]NKZ01446.1 hypothetical protein [Nocardiopsis alborubida]